MRLMSKTRRNRRKTCGGEWFKRSPFSKPTKVANNSFTGNNPLRVKQNESTFIRMIMDIKRTRQEELGNSWDSDWEDEELAQYMYLLNELNALFDTDPDGEQRATEFFTQLYGYFSPTHREKYDIPGFVRKYIKHVRLQRRATRRSTRRRI